MKKIPNIFGLIDSTQIRIIGPSTNEDHYINRKGFHSINTQIVCDHKNVITNVSAKWPGSVHDSTVLQNSSLWDHYVRPRADGQRAAMGLLLGDSGYPCKNWLLTPYKVPINTQAKERFNRYLYTCTRCVSYTNANTYLFKKYMTTVWYSKKDLMLYI